MSISSGTRLGPYEIVASIGAGGMGEVWRAKDTRLDREVAIKVLPSGFAENEQFLQRFEREARTISSLNHPHVCTLYDVGEVRLREGEAPAEPGREAAASSGDGEPGSAVARGRGFEIDDLIRERRKSAVLANHSSTRSAGTRVERLAALDRRDWHQSRPMVFFLPGGFSGPSRTSAPLTVPEHRASITASSE